MRLSPHIFLMRILLAHISTVCVCSARIFAARFSAHTVVRNLAPASVSALLALVFFASFAQAQDSAIYVVSNNTTISIISNQATGALTNVGTLSFGTSAAARDPASGNVYYLSTNAATPIGRVAYWNPATGANTVINATGSPGNIALVRLAFNAAGVLYALASNGSLYTINTANGAYTRIGTQPVIVTNRSNVTIPSNGDIAFGPDGTLYAAANCTNGVATAVCLFSINPIANPTAIEIGNLATLPNDTTYVASLGYGVGGVLYAGASNGAYYSVNTASGAGALIATNAGNAYWDFASMPKFANLSITKTAAPNPAIAGGTLTYTIQVTNNGAHTATNVRMSDPLPAGTLYRSHTAPTGWTCTTPAVGANGTVACTNGATGTLANAASATFTITVTAPSVAGTITNTASVTSDTIDAVAGNNSATRAVSVNLATVSGVVFEDANYGGGAGRSFTTASGAGRDNARVELYDASGNFVATTLTATVGGVAGTYTFTNLVAGNYTARVVNSTVTSARPGSIAGLLSVQTFRTNAGAPDTARVGGEDPVRSDAAAGATGTTLASLTAATTTAQSVAPLTITNANVTGVDFGFNFSTIVNINDAGQGSLRQFITNANALTNGSLNQSLPGSIEGGGSGIETSIFMISDGASHPGLRTGLTNQLNGGVAAITVNSLLPAITDQNTNLNGGTQTVNINNSNSGSLGAGGSVGVDNLALGTVERPEVQLTDGATNLAVGFDLQATNASVRRFAIYGFGTVANDDGSANIRIGASGTSAVIERNIVGATAVSFTDPGAGIRSTGDDVRTIGAANGTIRFNLIGFSAGKGIGIEKNSTGWLVQANELRGNAIGNSNLDGIDLESGSSNNTVRGNLSIANEGVGVDSYQGGGNNRIENNTIINNGIGAGANVETAGVRIYGALNTIERNVITANFGAGIMITPGATNNTITRNSIFANGTILNKAGAGTSAQIGIDLHSASDNAATGSGLFVSLNDDGDLDAGGNGLQNFPVIVTAQISGANLVLNGFAAPGATIELFIADPDPSGFGEGRTYLVTLTEGATSGIQDTDATTGAYSGSINGVNQGAETTTSKFTFTIPLASLPGATLGARLTATATVAGSTSEFSGNVLISNPPPNITLVKSVTPAGDAVPGAELTYTIAFANTGGQPAGNFQLTDPDPTSGLRLDSFTDFKLGSAQLTPGTTGLTATVEYSNDNGATWTFSPTSGGGGALAGYDNRVTHLRWRFTGNLSQSTPNNAGSVSFIVRIR